MDDIANAKEIIITDRKYIEFFNQAKDKITSTRIQIAKAALRGQFELYWWLGEQIALAQEKYHWGKSVVEQLSKDLKMTFAGSLGFSPQNL